MKIAIDAGHGKNTAGKRCLKSLDPDQTREWTLNSRIAEKLEALLKGYDCQIIRTDDRSGNTDVPLATRVNTANAAKADVFISIHHNAGANGTKAGGTNVYYYSDKKERKDQAMKLYTAVTNATGLVGNRADKTINHGFYVVKYTTMPAFLIENGFMDSATDTPIILTDEHAAKTAQGLLAFLVDHCKLQKKAASSSERKTLYCVQVGAYSIKANADECLEKARAAGFKDAYIAIK